MSEQVHVSYPADGVALLVLDNPPRNFISYALLERLAEALAEVRGQRAKVAVLASDAPGYFLAHAWLPDLINAYSDPKAVSGDPAIWRRVTTELERGPLVTIACNNGQAWGGGAEISWACNLRTAGRSATYAQIETATGISPGAGANVRLARLAGQSIAMEMILTSEPMSAELLDGYGVVNRLFEDDELRERTIEWAATIASRGALGACKRSILHTWDLDFENAMRMESHIFNSTMTPAALERMRAGQARYDDGADSWEVFGLRRPEPEAVS